MTNAQTENGASTSTTCLASHVEAMACTNGLDQTTFVADGRTYDATLRNLELIGEAATHVPESVRAEYAAIPWRQIIATRNRLNHAYLGIDADTIWSIVRDDLPELVACLEQMKRNRASD